jgi:hypothetical protein
MVKTGSGLSVSYAITCSKHEAEIHSPRLGFSSGAYTRLVEFSVLARLSLHVAFSLILFPKNKDPLDHRSHVITP